ncbi:hypothetical protein PROFUN_16216 [Planoprotostelium fungivorum]|uniref:Uncharacterized protein n=1 Tax=Planoprotostelium fungivorum TaxID=1890364 RepID=A0A2P6MNL7_9EUKA|nr:hypothetical protein PROFUN_16216 [Planoprotostelium fungivorum]
MSLWLRPLHVFVAETTIMSLWLWPLLCVLDSMTWNHLKRPDSYSRLSQRWGQMCKLQSGLLLCDRNRSLMHENITLDRQLIEESLMHHFLVDELDDLITISVKRMDYLLRSGRPQGKKRPKHSLATTPHPHPAHEPTKASREWTIFYVPDVLKLMSQPKVGTRGNRPICVALDGGSGGSNRDAENRWTKDLIHATDLHHSHRLRRLQKSTEDRRNHRLHSKPNILNIVKAFKGMADGINRPPKTVSRGTSRTNPPSVKRSGRQTVLRMMQYVSHGNHANSSERLSSPSYPSSTEQAVKIASALSTCSDRSHSHVSIYLGHALMSKEIPFVETVSRGTSRTNPPSVKRSGRQTVLRMMQCVSHGNHANSSERLSSPSYPSSTEQAVKIASALSTCSNRSHSHVSIYLGHALMSKEIHFVETVLEKAHEALIATPDGRAQGRAEEKDLVYLLRGMISVFCHSGFCPAPRNGFTSHLWIATHDPEEENAFHEERL